MGLCQLAVCGLHLKGQPLNHQLTDLGGKFVRTCKSGPYYRFFAIHGQARTLYRFDELARTGHDLRLSRAYFSQQGLPTKPGMVFVTDGTGNAIHLEIWELTVSALIHNSFDFNQATSGQNIGTVAAQIENLGHFLLKVPPPLAIGTVQLEGGDSCLGFVAEGYVMHAEGNEDITHLGSWPAYIEQLA